MTGKLSFRQLGNRFANFITSLLLQHHNLEPLEIVESSPLLAGHPLLSPCRLRPLLVDFRFLPRLLDDSATGSTGQFGEDVRGERNVFQGDGLTFDRWRVDEYSFMVDDFDDSPELASTRPIVQKHNAADFNIPPLGRNNFSGHCV